jgi:hypothetical protein
MKILLDESIPLRLKREFSEHDAHTVWEMGWQGKRKQELLALMMADGFDVFLAFDKTLQYQRNFASFPIAVWLLSANGNDYHSLLPLVPLVKQQLKGGKPAPGVKVVQQD